MTERPSDQLDCSVEVDGPVRNHERTGSRIEKGAGEAGKHIKPFKTAAARGRVARRQHHPIGVEFQACDL